MDPIAYKFLAVGISALSVIGAGISIGFATASVCKSIAQQPEADNKIRNAFLLGAAMAEATAIYGFVIAILLIFAAK